MNEILTFATIILPIITAVTQMIKQAVSIPKNIIPLIALIIGLIIGFAAQPFAPQLDSLERLWGGGLAGLSSTGLFELAFNKRSGKSK
ncbi:holin [Terrilactibacillus sp. BCM23-1]|uniref:Holin n=1 Tax=Terrilactibacillus tamarindi TaxID=2599694 RepID=A0A6N8CLK4_9BACI|nr:holin [Terrilactibacillus tamarindi]MTT30822.1 holin [Terrilactibacillus tamarindi]